MNINSMTRQQLQTYIDGDDWLEYCDHHAGVYSIEDAWKEIDNEVQRTSNEAWMQHETRYTL